MTPKLGLKFKPPAYIKQLIVKIFCVMIVVLTDTVSRDKGPN